MATSPVPGLGTWEFQMPHGIWEASLFEKGEMYKARMNKKREDLVPCFFHHPRLSGPGHVLDTGAALHALGRH